MYDEPMRRWVVGSLCISNFIFFVVSSAAPESLTSDKVAAYHIALAEGRKLLQQNKYAAAAEAFAKAVAAQPEDVTALSELGWAAFLTGDLKSAEQTTAKALQYGGASPRASTLYNQGRIQEALGRRQQAIESYQQSLRLRPNTVVRERLGSLDPEAASAGDPLGPTRLEGPQRTLAALTQSLLDSIFGAQDQEAAESVESTALLPTPVGGVREVQQITWQSSGELSGALALRTSHGWFRTQSMQLGMRSGNSWANIPFSRCRAEVSAGPIRSSLVRCTMQQEARDSFGRQTCRDGGSLNAHDMINRETVIWCSEGPSGIPSCTPSVQIAEKRARFDCKSEYRTTANWQLGILRAPGRITLTLDPRKRLGYSNEQQGSDSQGLLGPHFITFP